MRSKAHRRVLLFFTLLLLVSQGLAQSMVEAATRLFIRYEDGASGNRIIEDVLTLTLSISGKDRTTIAIRVCSKELMPFALATAGADPYRIAELLRDGYKYPPERVLFLRSEDCLSSKDSSMPVTEIWAVPEGAPLPQHVEAFKSNQLRLISLGKRQANRGIRDYRAALDKLIENLRANPKNVGIVIGYFLDHPSPELQRRLREATTILEQSGLSRERYLAQPVLWNDEVSIYPPDSEPQYPSVFIVEVAGECARR